MISDAAEGSISGFGLDGPHFFKFNYLINIVNKLILIIIFFNKQIE